MSQIYACSMQAFNIPLSISLLVVLLATVTYVSAAVQLIHYDVFCEHVHFLALEDNYIFCISKGLVCNYFFLYFLLLFTIYLICFYSIFYSTLVVINFSFYFCCYLFIIECLAMLEVAVVQQVVCWLIRRKARVRVSGQTSKTKYEKYFFGDFLSADFWQKL